MSGHLIFAFMILGIIAIVSSKEMPLPTVADEKLDFEGLHRPNVLITHPDTPKEGIDTLRRNCNVTIVTSNPPNRAEILEKAKGMHGILWATHEPLNAEVLDAAGPQLKALSTMSAGVDYVDLAEVRRRGIPIGYTPRVLDNAVADLAMGLVIAAARRFHEGRLKIEHSKWEQRPQWMLGQDFEGRTVGIIGFGNIGSTIAKRLTGFDVHKILYTGHKEKPEAKKIGAEFVSLDELLSKSDFVFVSAPLTNETRGMFNDDAFDKMKSSAVFVNVARGEIVDQEALVRALENGKIFAAGIDVMYPEPLPPNHPMLNVPNLVISPHLGSATNDTRQHMSVIAAHNVLRGIAGVPMFSPIPE